MIMDGIVRVGYCVHTHIQKKIAVYTNAQVTEIDFRMVFFL